MGKDKGYRQDENTCNYNSRFTFFQTGDLLLFPHMNNLGDGEDNINSGSQSCPFCVCRKRANG